MFGASAFFLCWPLYYIKTMSRPSVVVQRRTSMPQALEDPDDITVLGEKDEYIVTTDPHGHDDEALLAGRKLVPRPTLPIPVETIPKELRNMLAGGIAGMAAKTVVAPLDRIKILFQISSVKFRLLNVPKVARNIVRDEGITALWKGNTATMIRVFPYSGIQFMTFDRVKSYYLHQHEAGAALGSSSTAEVHASLRHRQHHLKFGRGLTPAESLIGGMIAGTVSVICTYPLDLTRAQLAVRRKHKHEHNLGFSGVLKQTYRMYGWQGLFRGIVPTVLGILPYSGIAFALNEQGKREVRAFDVILLELPVDDD
jgi:hypothetical protein